MELFFITCNISNISVTWFTLCDKKITTKWIQFLIDKLGARISLLLGILCTKFPRMTGVTMKVKKLIENRYDYRGV